MAWEFRNGRGGYYTRSRRVNGRVVRQYVGCGRVAELAARMDEISRQQREAEAEMWRRERERIESLDASIATICEISDLFARLALIDAGFHQHNRGEWRKRRVKTKTPAAD